MFRPTMAILRLPKEEVVIANYVRYVQYEGKNKGIK